MSKLPKLPKYTIAVTYNVKKGLNNVSIPDEEAEYDSSYTIDAIKSALIGRGQNVILMEADISILEKIKSEKIDFVFNIAEGLHGRARESFIPSLLTAMQIPYTGSDEATLSTTLDKSLCKKVVSFSNIKTPGFSLIREKGDKIASTLTYPLIVKPNAEGSGKGIIDVSVAKNEDELYTLTNRIIELYKQPALVEEFIKGREFTVSMLGNDNEVEVLPPMEIIYKKPQDYNIYNYNIKQNYKDYVQYVCPADISKQVDKQIRQISKIIFRDLECKDFSRIDFIMDEIANEIYFIEINPLPGLTPSYSDFPMTAEFSGISYDDLIIRILNNALKRYKMDII